MALYLYTCQHMGLTQEFGPPDFLFLGTSLTSLFSVLLPIVLILILSHIYILGFEYIMSGTLCLFFITTLHYAFLGSLVVRRLLQRKMFH